MPIRTIPSLRGRLLLFLTAVFALLFAGLLFEHADGERHAREKALARATDLARSYVHQYDRLLRERLAMLDTLLRLPGFEQNDPVRCEETLRHIVATDPSLVNLVLLDGQNRMRCAGRPGSITDAAAATVRRALESRGAMVGMSGTEGQARAYLTLARPILDGSGAVRSVLLAYLDRNWLNAHFTETVPAGVVLRIFDGDGVFVVRQPNPECCVGKSGLQLGGIGKALAGGREQARKSIWLDGVERLQADLALAAPLSGVVSIGIPEAHVLSEADRAMTHLSWLLAALCLALYGLTWLFSDRTILRPLRALSEGARRLREGELAFRIPESVGSGEFALLRRDFNEMADTLSAREGEIRRDLAKLAASGQALRESESRFRNLYEQAPLPHQSLDADGTILDVNAAWCELFGRPREEVLGRCIGEYLSEESRLLLDDRLTRFKTEGRTNVNVFEIVRPDGEKRLVEVNGRIARDAEGNFLRTHCILSDVTERREKELGLRLAASVFEQANEAITITDEKATIIAVSRRFTDITGYRADEVIGRNPRILQSGRQDAAFYKAMWGALTSTGHWSGEIWNKRKDGAIYPEWLSISAVRDEGGRTTNYVAVFSDLTERHAANTQLRESRERLTTLIEAIPDPIFFKDGENRWQIINAAAKRLFRIGDLPWQGKTDLELALLQQELSGEHMGCWSSDEAAWRNRAITQSTEVLRGDDGRTLIYSVNRMPLFDAEGRRQALVIHGRDVTDQHRHAEELQRLNNGLELRVMERTRALQTANRELEAFSYSVSHDLRAPLRAINGFSHLLDEEYTGTLDDKARSYLSRVRAASERMGQLIDDLLHLSQMSRRPMRVVPTNLSEMATEIAAELQADDPARQVEWVIAPDVITECDESLLRAVMQNLLGNAWKYSARRADAHIEFGVFRKDGQPVYFVRDNGAGFDMAHAGRLFGAFQRLHSPAEFPGSGIGLATVARIVHRHDGKVWAEGSPDAGATFYFTLQARAGSPTPERHGN